MGPKKKSSVWQFFNKIDDKKTKCKLCQKEIKSAGNTTNLIGHVRNVHKAAYLEIQPKQNTLNAEEISNPLNTKVTPNDNIDDGLLQSEPIPSTSGSGNKRSCEPLPKTSCVASDELRKATAAAMESPAGVKLIQSVDTRWNSTYYMLQRFLELRSVINDILFRHPRAPAMLSASDISTVSSVIVVLRPLEAATKEISGDKYCTSSKIIPLVRCMLSKITSAVIEDPVAKEVQKLAINEINKRMGSIEHVSALAIASILDPRFKRIHFNDAIACSNAVSKIKDIMKKNLQSNEEPESDSDKSDKNEEVFSLWTDHHKLVHRNWKINKSEDVLSDELSVYLRSPVGRLNENPLEIWRDYKIQFPKLYKIAFKYLTIVGTYYLEFLEKNEEDTEKVSSHFTPQHLEDKIVNSFSKEVKIFFIHNKKLLAPKYLKSIDDQSFESLQDEDILQKAALLLRKLVKQIPIKKLPENITVQNLKEGEVSVPQALSEFYFTLISGGNQKRKKERKCIRQVQSYCEDVIYSIYNGKIKTSKHIVLGMTLKSLTSSRKIIDIVHRYGHCISYPGIEELETEATYTSIQKSTLCPETIKKTHNLCTGVAYDNFDRFVETGSGKDTLHDTVGIIYQNLDQDNQDLTQSSNVISPNDEEASDLKRRRRRTFEAITVDKVPYPKKPKMTDAMQVSLHEVENLQPVNMKVYNTIDIILMISHALQIPKVPISTGNYETKSANLSRLTKFVKTYDLAIAKIALQIQATEKPTFDNLFIHLGPFHIMMAYFKVIGKFIIDSGLPNVMVQSNLLAMGSLNGFLEGKHFNRCKRFHPLVAIGLEVLHFKSFLEIKNIVFTDLMVQEVIRLGTCPISSFKIENEELDELLNDYNIYKQETLNGEHGKTAQFYLIYVRLVHYYLTLSRSIRIGDYELFRFILPKITNLFFVCNQQNYARWGVNYHTNLLNVATTHPDIFEEFKKGCFGIKRTNKPFSSQPIDLVLEQTINADAARRLTGITQFTNSISARQRWARSHDLRSTIIISYVYEKLDLQKDQDITADLNDHNIQNSNMQLQIFMNIFQQFINPFDVGVPKNVLINISTGKAASAEVETFLLNIEEHGEALRKTFIAECEADISRFEKSIKRTKLQNFSQDYSKKKKTTIGGKIQEVRVQRDLFGRMLGISINHKIDISKILSYPITFVPLSMCHLDGAICKTPKSALMKCLDKDIEHHPPPYIDILIIDGFFILHSMKDVPKSFGNISKKLLKMVTQINASRIDVIFDQYFTPSIKDYERSVRQECSQLEFTITGPDQIQPADFYKEIKNSHFKQALVNFLIVHWATDEMAPFIGNKLIKNNFMECHSFIVMNNRVVSTIDQNLSCPQHEEADTKIIYHVCNIDTQENIAIRCSDTDVTVIMLGHMHRLKDMNSHVWVLTGTGNNQRYVDLTKIYDRLGPFLCRSLIGFHAITGCDYNPAFFNKEKKRPFKILQRRPEYQQAFTKFGELELFVDKKKEEDVFDVIQKFICELYNISGIIDVDAARLQLFINKYTVVNVNEEFNRNNLRNFDASSLPPCKSELLQQFRRANYIASIWNNAHEKQPSTLSPENNGWILKDSQYDCNWFDGDQLPSFVSDSLQNESEEPNDDDHDGEDELNIQYECEFDEGSRNSSNEENGDE
ncbi:unnamed protein product, partial [Brenthis ino]